MNTYTITYITMKGTVLSQEIHAMGLPEAVELFIEEYCPVRVITAVQLHASPKYINRESQAY